MHQVDAGGQLHQVAAAGEPAGGVHPGAGAGRLGDRPTPATRPNQSKPLTAPATSSAVASPQPPATQHRPGGDHAALHHHDRDAVEQRLDPVLAHGGVDAAGVDVAQVRVDVGAWRRRA